MPQWSHGARPNWSAPFKKDHNPHIINIWWRMSSRGTPHATKHSLSIYTSIRHSSSQSDGKTICVLTSFGSTFMLSCVVSWCLLFFRVLGVRVGQWCPVQLGCIVRAACAIFCSTVLPGARSLPSGAVQCCLEVLGAADGARGCHRVLFWCRLVTFCDYRHRLLFFFMFIMSDVVQCLVLSSVVGSNTLRIHVIGNWNCKVVPESQQGYR